MKTSNATRIGCLSLRGCIARKCEIEGEQFCFQLETPMRYESSCARTCFFDHRLNTARFSRTHHRMCCRTYFLKGESEQEIDEWLEALDKQIRAASEVHPSSSSSSSSSTPNSRNKHDDTALLFAVDLQRGHAKNGLSHQTRSGAQELEASLLYSPIGQAYLLQGAKCMTKRIVVTNRSQHSIDTCMFACRTNGQQVR
jgi:hypothetical protein